MAVDGALRRQIAASGDDPRKLLPLVGQLLASHGLDVVADYRLGYEARASCSCAQCGVAFIGTKSGQLLAVSLRETDGGGRPATAMLETEGAIRHLLHLPDPGARRRDPSASPWVLLVGTDDGRLHLVRQRGAELERVAWVDVAARWAGDDRRTVPFPAWLDAGVRARSVARRKEGPPPAADASRGITALATWPPIDCGAPATGDAVTLLVATREGRVYPLLASRGVLRCRRPPIAVHGWVQWIVSEPEQVVCVSRGGHAVTIAAHSLGGDGGATDPAPLVPLPLSLRRFERDGRPPRLLAGTERGLSVHDKVWRDVRLPVGAAAVSALGVVDCYDCHYVALGMSNGRVTLLGESFLDRDRGKKFSVRLDDGVVALEALRLGRAPGQPSDVASTEDRGRDHPAYLVVALRNHAVRIYRVEDFRYWSQRATDLWKKWWSTRGARLAGLDGDQASPFTVDAVRIGLVDLFAHGRAAAGSYLLLESVVPALAPSPSPAGGSDGERAAHCAAVLADLVRAAGGATAGAEGVRTLYTASSRFGALVRAGGFAAVRRVSLELLRAMPRRSDDEWTRFVAQHQEDLQRAAPTAGEDARSFIAWTDYVRKFLGLGHTFASKEVGLGALVDSNRRRDKPIDALIYKSLLYQRRHDALWVMRLDDLAVDALALFPLQLGDGARGRRRPARTVVVAVAANGRFTVLDGATGAPGAPCHVRVAGLARLSPLRTDAAVAWYHAERRSVRVALAWTNDHPDEPASGLTVFELDGDGTPRRSQDVDLPRGAAVRSLCVLDPRRDLLAAGMEGGESPLAVLGRPAGTGKRAAWCLEPSHLVGTPAEAASGIGAVNVVAAMDQGGADRWICAAGGQAAVLAIVGLERRADGWRCSWRESHAVLHPVTAVALDRIEDLTGRRERQAQCFAGTASGELFCFAVRDDAGAVDARAARTAADGTASTRQALWRDVHSGRVRSLSVSRSPLYHGRPVLVVATQRGRVSLYETAHWPLRGGGDRKDALSESSNFLFRGLRHDRVNFAPGLQAFAASSDSSRYVVARGDGRIEMGELCHTRDARDRAGSLAELQALFDAACAWHERAGLGDRAESLALLDLVHLREGSLGRYLARQRFPGRFQPDDDGDAELRSAGAEYLDALHLDLAGHRERFKAAIKGLVRQVIGRPSDQLAAFEDDARWRAAHDRVHRMVEWIRNIIGAHANRAAAPEAVTRILITGFSECFRPHLLHALGREWGAASSGDRPLTGLVESWLEQCLAHDDAMIQVETLRAVAVALRNLGVRLRALAPGPAALLAQQLFPTGLASIEWLLQLLVRNLRRFPHLREEYLSPVAWWTLSALMAMFWLFDEDTFVLCRRVLDAGLDPEVLAILAARFQGDDVARIAAKIAFYTQEWRWLRGGADVRDAFIAHCTPAALRRQVGSIRRALQRTQVGGADGGDAGYLHRAERLLPAVRELWRVDHRDALAALLADAAGPMSQLAADDDRHFGRFSSWLRSAAALLALRETRGIHDGLERAQSDLASGAGAAAGLTSLQRTVAEGLVSWWRRLYVPATVGVGEVIAGHRLRSYRGPSGAHAELWDAVDDVSGRDVGHLRVFRHSGPPGQVDRMRQEFLQGAYLNQRLFEVPFVVRVHQIIPRADHPACLVEACSGGRLAELLASVRRRRDRLRLCDVAARQLLGALHCAHWLDVAHGDLRTETIHVDAPPGAKPGSPVDLVFKLGDFDRAHVIDAGANARAGVPAADGAAPLLARRTEFWRAEEMLDFLQLACVLYEILTREPLRPDADRRTLAGARERLQRLPEQPTVRVLLEAFDLRRDFPYRNVSAVYQAVAGEPPPKMGHHPATWVLDVGDHAMKLSRTDFIGRELRTLIEADTGSARFTDELLHNVDVELKKAENAVEHKRLAFLHAAGELVYREALPRAIRDELERHWLAPTHPALVITGRNNQLPLELAYSTVRGQFLGERFWVSRSREYRHGAGIGRIVLDSALVISLLDDVDRDALRELFRGCFDELDVVVPRTQRELDRVLRRAPVDFLYLLGHHHPERGFHGGAGARRELHHELLQKAPLLAESDRGRKTLVMANGCATSDREVRLVGDFGSALEEKGAVLSTTYRVTVDGVIAVTRALLQRLQAPRGPRNLARVLREIRAEAVHRRHPASAMAYALYAPPDLEVALVTADRRRA